MHEEEKQPQQMPHQVDEGRYKKLFGLDIYLTPVFVISSITIIAFIIGTLSFVRIQEAKIKEIGQKIVKEGELQENQLRVEIRKTALEELKIELPEDDLLEKEIQEIRQDAKSTLLEKKLKEKAPVLFNGVRV